MGLDGSHVRGAEFPPLMEQTIGAALDNAARSYGGRLALVSRHQQIRWSYAELNERADALAAGLLGLGLAPGDRIGIWAPNCAEWTLTQFAAARAGLVLVTINTAYRRAELQYALNKVDCRALVLATGHRGIDYRGMIDALSRDGEIDGLKHRILTGEPADGFLSFDPVARG